MKQSPVEKQLNGRSQHEVDHPDHDHRLPELNGTVLAAKAVSTPPLSRSWLALLLAPAHALECA
jgi:hypothetical protein